MKSVVIIGAGPYGLSLSAYLRHAGIDSKIFGKPMGVWQHQMPAGMLLKSDGCASSLYEPGGTFTLRRFCEQQGIAYQDRGLPVALDTFIAYGLAFQKQFVPDLDTRDITRIERRKGGGFLVHPAGGEPIATSKVVVAVGISHFQYVPTVFAGLSGATLSHSSEHRDLSTFRGQDVIVVGAGASALDSAALLHRHGSRVQLLARRSTIAFHQPPRTPSLLQRLRNPPTGIGPGWKNVFYTELPLAFHRLPQPLRLDVVRRHLGPAPGWFTRKVTEGQFPFILGATPIEASERDGRARLTIETADGSRRTLECDHVLAATGYRVDLRRIPFLPAEDLLGDIDSVDHAPRLSANFETSVEGLYFTGLAAANSFGPVLRFAFGSRFASPHLARHLVRSSLFARPRTALRPGANLS